MITHDPTFEYLAQANIKRSDVIVAKQELLVGGYSDTTPTWTSATYLMDVTIDAVGQMLGAATKKAVVKLQYKRNGIAVTTPIAGDLFQIRTGIYNEDPSASGFNYISQGFFIVDEVAFDYDAGSVTITMYDHMWTASETLYNEAIVSDAITYPATVETLAAKVAEVLDVTLDPNFSTLPNSQYDIQQELYSTISGTRLQNVIQDIAGATATTARITDNVLIFSPYVVSNELLDKNVLKELKIGDTYGPVTSVILGRVPQNDNIALYSANPTENEVTSVNTTTNILTIVGHGMADGNMIHLISTGTLPAPLIANHKYYVYTNADLDSFALAPTYQDAIDGTNLIDLTTAGSGTITIPPFLTKEIQINNNEILDDERQDLLPPLYNVLSGIDWTAVKAKTTGFGWHEVGDVIQFTEDGRTVRAFLTEVHTVFDGSIKEELISVVPELANINYQAAGGIAKTLYNTEIKVDKQNQEITSVVSRQDTLEGQVNQQYSEINQDVNNVMITIQRAGGGNILYNSVGFAKETFRDLAGLSYDKLLYWNLNDPYDIATNGRVTSYSSSASQAAGGISGQVIEMTGTDLKISQRVTIGAGVPLFFAMMVKNTIGTGTAKVTLTNDTDNFELDIDDAQSYDWTTFKLDGVDFKSTMPWLDVTIQVTNAQKFVFSDLRLMYGGSQGWVQANGEILSANVQFTTEGVRVFDSVHDTETRMTFNEFSTRTKTSDASLGKVLFEADDQGILTNNLSIQGRTSYMNNDETIIKQITVGSANPKSGLAFIKVVE